MRRQGECVGVELGFGQDIELTLSRFLQAGFDFIAAPLTNPLYRPSKVTESPYEASSSIPPPFAGSDLVLTPAQWSGHIVGKISSWIDLDSNDEIVRTDSETTLKKEVSWAAHLSLQAIILPTPARPLDCGNYARCVNRILQQVSNMQLWLRMPLVSPKLQKAEGTPEEDSVYLERDPMTGKLVSDTWEWWNMFRMLCDHHSHLCVALDITESLPPQSAIARWMGEPVKAAILHTSAFLTNKKGYPCLSKHHQSLITTFLDHSVQVIITGEAGHEVDAIALVAPASENANGSEESAVLRHALKPYQEYIAFLYRHMKPLTEQERLELGYRDFLQAPLQPLMDNLEAQTYETFEKDATKYTQYQKAVHAALLDRVSDKDASTTTTVLMVVGAGRGPLVRASLQAAEETGRKLRVYAVEKNPNAVVTLHSLVKLQGWADIVTVVSCDMRHWNAPEKADIMVSELLGSFGDNELSPECLDGAQRFLKEDGISIPSSYTSFIAPITASKLYNDVKAYNDVAHFETAYVVKLHSVARLTPPQPVFSFFHPNLSRNIDNERYKQLVFELPVEAGSSLIHGFAGYFDSTLYKDIHLGIEPSTATPNMFSWFAIFFPLSKPVYVPVDSKMEVHFWRCVGETKVWYEWAVTAPSVSPIHNSNGRSYSVGL